jgi:secreted PhoX family phosphatase
VIDLKTGRTKVIANERDWTALDGIRWTPWGTILFAEETAGGRLFELTLDKNDLMSGTVEIYPNMGLMAHEGIEVDNNGSIYLVDEYRGQSVGCGVKNNTIKACGGGIYKFIPHQYGKLEYGDLYMLKVTGEDGVGQAQWVGPIDASNIRLSGAAFGGTSYQRPEDLELIDDVLYVAITEGSQNESGEQKYDGRVLALDLTLMTVSNFVKAGLNAPIEIGHPGDEHFQSGLDNPDNLAESPDGKLIIIEDNNPSDIWFASSDNNNDGTADNVWLFASLTDPEGEGSGIYFGKNPKVMFVNVQHSKADDGDATWAIIKD